MATATPVINYGVTDPPARTRPGASRHFFFGLMVVYALVAIAGFVPNLIGFVRGTFPMSWAAHVHGLLMISWLALLVAQSRLPAGGKVRQHQRLGGFIAGFAVLIWVSLVAVAARGIAVDAPPLGAFRYDILLLQLMVVLLLPLFLIWAIRERRNPGWHKRLILFAVLPPLLASVDRMPWLPRLGPADQWVNFLYLDLLLVPLWWWDLRTRGRPHPATAIGTAITLAAQAVASLLWMSPAWHDFAYALTSPLR